MAEATAREVEAWPVGEEFALRPRMQSITLEVILRAVFGVRDGERMDLFRRAHPAPGRDHERVRAGCPSWTATWAASRRRPLPPRARRGGRADLRRDRRAPRRPSPGDDVLSLLLSARHEDGSPMSDVELRDELMTLLTAGPRDDRHRALLGARAPDAHAARDGAAARLARRRRVPRRRGEGDAARPPRDRGRGPQAHPRDRDRRLHCCRPERWCFPPSPPCTRGPDLYPEPERVPARALHRRRSPSRTPGSRSAAACGAASARRSPRWRCGWCCARCCGGCGCRALAAAGAPARAARDRGAGARRARGGRPSGCARPAAAGAAARRLAAATGPGPPGARRSGRGPARLGPGGDAGLPAAAAARVAADLVQLALRVPEPHRARSAAAG